MKIKHLLEGAEPKMPGAPQGIQIMTPQQFVAKAGDMPGEESEEGVAEGSDDKEPFDYEKWKASTVKPRKPRGYKDAEALGKAIDSEQSELRKRKEQGVAEGLGKSIKRASQGWGVGAAPDMVTPSGAVSAFKNMDGQRLANFVASRKDQSKPRKNSAGAFVDKVIDREMRQRGYGRVANKDEQGVAEGVAETLPMDDAVKVLRQYGADHFKTTSNELHFYKQGRPFSVDLVMNPDATRSVTLSSLNSATRGLKGQGVAEGSKKSITPEQMIRDAVEAYKQEAAKENPNTYILDSIKSNINDIKREIERKKQGVAEEKQRLDPSCWDGYKKQGTKMKGDTRVNNCVPKESAIMKGLADGNRRGDK